MNPVVVHVVRPYANEQDYLAAEAWSIESRSMLLLEAEPLAAGTVVLFDITLGDGQKPIRAEGRVVGEVAADGDRPGGLKVRFKRFGSATKAFIERAVQAKASEQAEGLSSAPEADRPSFPEAELSSAPEADRPSFPEAELSSAPEAELPSQPQTELPSQPQTELRSEASQDRSSGLRPKLVAPVAAPANREELLERLRRRKRTG